MTRKGLDRVERMRSPQRSMSLGVLALVLGTVGAGPVAAQVACDETAGTLGVQGLRCEGCSYRMSESGIEEARFRTEPQVLALVRGVTEGDALEPGDRIVAVDGALITTREGSDRLVDLRAGQRVTLRVRRDGRLVDLAMVAGSACELRRQMEGQEVEVERMEDIEGTWSVVSVPPAPAPLPRPAPTARPVDSLPPLPPLPAVPAAPAVPPTGWLGFGLRCSGGRPGTPDCGWRDGAFFFAAPPEIIRVAESGPAGQAGLRSGDRLVAVDGEPITGGGGRRFGEVEPGQSVALTVERDGEQRTVTVAVAERPAVRPAAPALPGQAVDGRVQFQGRVGDTFIEVTGSPVQVRSKAPGADSTVLPAGSTMAETTKFPDASNLPDR